jgi:hypothetical protein
LGGFRFAAGEVGNLAERGGSEVRILLAAFDSEVRARVPDNDANF